MGGECLKHSPTSFEEKSMSNKQFIDYTGCQFGKLRVIKRIGSKRYFPKKKGKRRRVSTFAIWLCQCDCGREIEVTSNGLRAGTKSCGCLWKNRKGRIRKGYENGFAAANYVF